MKTPDAVEIVLTDGFEVFARQTALPAELDETLRDLNAMRPRWRQAITYREPVDVVCQKCGVKFCTKSHT